MNYIEITTTADLIKAFRLCENSGERIELFEKLATQDDPPTDAFVQILREIKLEIPLVLSIRAFGAITNENIKESLKQSDDLLAMLSQQAKSGVSDLIRWAAAVTIDTIGFDFLTISQYLTEEPSKIATKIVASKGKIVTGLNEHRGVITERNDYQELVDFWVYGPTYELKVITSNWKESNSSVLIDSVVENLSVYGIKETNKISNKLGSSVYSFRGQDCDNYLFESATQSLSSKLLKDEKYKNEKYFDCCSLFLTNQGHFLQSDYPDIRLKAASVITSMNRLTVYKLSGQQFNLSNISQAICDCNFNINKDFSYRNITQEDLAEKVENLRKASQLVSRKGISNYFNEYLTKLSHDLSLLLPGLSWNKMIAIEEGKQLEEQSRKLIIKKTEEDRIAKLKADKEKRKNLIANSIKLALISPVIFFALVCVGAYFNSPRVKNITPLTGLVGGAIFGPIVWLVLSFVLIFGFIGAVFNIKDMSILNASSGIHAFVGELIVETIGSFITWGSPFWMGLLKEMKMMKAKR